MSQFEDLPDNAVDFFRAHVKLYLTDPARAHLWDATPVGGPGVVETLLLTTIGRKTGKTRHAPVLYVADGDSYLIMASRGGTEINPAWFANLASDPECEIRVGIFHTRAIAHVLDGDERERAWDKVTAIRPVYLKYQSRTTRRIPVIRLTPHGQPLP